MLLSEKEYLKIRPEIKPGDIIAFSGRGLFSSVIRWITGWESSRNASVSHIGIVINTKRTGTKKSGHFVQVIESTSLDGFTGVVINRLSKRIREYNGEMWWLPLSDAVRAKMDTDKFFDFLMEQKGKPYDNWQCVKCGLDFLPFVHIRENMDKLFCSELVAQSLDESGCIPHVNASSVNPIDICRWKIYKNYVQLTGKPRRLFGFCTINIEKQDYCTGDDSRTKS
jgi:hypothetical protein